MFYSYAIVNDVTSGAAPAAPFTPSAWRFADGAAPHQATPEIPAVSLLLFPSPPPPPITPVFMNTARVSFV